MTFQYRYLVPNAITFASLVSGFVSILSSGQGNLRLAGVLVMASYVLDLFDGYAARKLDARTEFGLQLDSLVDMVSLGVAPAALLFAHLIERQLSPVLVWPLVVLIPLAGAFRLARFNLLPAKVTGSVDSVGLTISTAGATLSLAVLTDLGTTNLHRLPASLFVIMPIIVSLLMVSTISFPSLGGVFSGRWRSAFLITLIGAALVFWPFVQAWLLFNTGYLGLTVARAGYSLRTR